MNYYGFVVFAPFTGVFTKNNMMGSVGCGLYNLGVIGLNATNNYWGAAPGTPSADEVCNSGGTTNYLPWATKPFTVMILKP
jgi:hypothetical protein